MISASSPHCHSRLSKPILKILSIHIQKIFLGKYFPKLYFVEVLDRQSAGLSLFIADRAGNMSGLLLEIGSSRAAVDYKNEVLKTWQISKKTFKTISLFS